MIDAVTEVASELTAEELASLGVSETGVASVINAISEVSSELPPTPSAIAFIACVEILVGAHPVGDDFAFVGAHPVGDWFLRRRRNG